ncbi:hypothetical protein M433DRAFT_7873 [Acidomyces richmondensis BFW]|nr:hypothetical protein M433DRAFT_7873 [Acidomyces richmondensis BFW]
MSSWPAPYRTPPTSDTCAWDGAEAWKRGEVGDSPGGGDTTKRLKMRVRFGSRAPLALDAVALLHESRITLRGRLSEFSHRGLRGCILPSNNTTSFAAARPRGVPNLPRPDSVDCRLASHSSRLLARPVVETPPSARTAGPRPRTARRPHPDWPCSVWRALAPDAPPDDGHGLQHHRTGGTGAEASVSLDWSTPPSKPVSNAQLHIKVPDDVGLGPCIVPPSR